MHHFHIVLFFLILSAKAYADFTSDGAQTVQAVSLGCGGEGVYVQADKKPSLCSASNYFMPPNAPMFKENYAALLAAYQSAGKVVLWYNGCESYGAGSLKAVTLTK